VLLIDLDPQGQLEGARRRGRCGAPHGAEPLARRCSARDAPALPIIRARHPNLDIIPSNKSLALFPQEAAEHPGDENHCLRDALERAPAYDFVLFDAPPSFGISR
jgi:chromosome partitioning protein